MKRYSPTSTHEVFSILFVTDANLRFDLNGCIDLNGYAA